MGFISLIRDSLDPVNVESLKAGMPDRSPYFWKLAFRSGYCIVAVYLMVVAALWAFEDRLIFHPVKAESRWIDPPADVEYHDVWFVADGNRVHARWFPSREAQAAVLFCHSRAGNLSLELDAENVRRWTRDLRCSVLIFDYPGYGRSEGTPSEMGFYAAADAAHDWLTNERGLSESQILIYGRSIGTAVAIEQASRRKPRAVILISPLTSLPNVVYDTVPLVPAQWLMRNRFDSASRIDRVTAPTFVVHGTADRTIPFHQGQTIAARLKTTKQFQVVPNAGHGNCITPAFFNELKSFLECLNVE